MSGLLQMQGLSRCIIVASVAVVLSTCLKLTAQESDTREVPGIASPAVSERSGTIIHEALPRIIYTRDEDDELIPWVESFPYDRYEQFMRGMKGAIRESFVVTDALLEADAQKNSVTIANTFKIRLFDDRQVRVPIGMRRSHFLSQPAITSDTKDASVFARFNEKANEYELLVSGKSGQELTIEFVTQVVLQQVGKRAFFRLSIPRMPNSKLVVKTPESDVFAGVTDGMTVRRVAASEGDDSNAAKRALFQVDGLLPDFEFWWQPQKIANAKEAFSVEGDIDVTVDRLGEVSSVATLRLSSFNKPIEGFTVQLPPDTRWSPASNAILSGDYTVSTTDNTNGRGTLQVVFDEASLKPPPVRLNVESDKKEGPSDASMKYEISGFHVPHAVSEYGRVRVFSESDWNLNFMFGDFARQTNEATGPSEKTFAYSRPDQLTMVVTKQTSQLIVEPIYIVTLEATVAQLTAIYRCTRRGARRCNLQVEMGPWIYQSLRSDLENYKIESPELLSPNNGRLDIPLTITSDRFDVILNASLSIEDGLNTVNDVGDGAGSFTKLFLDFPAPLGADDLLQSTVVLQNGKTLAVTAGIAPEYTEVSVPDQIRPELDASYKALCYRMRAAANPATLPVLAARVARSTNVEIETEIVDINQERIQIRQEMHWQVAGVPLSTALLTIDEDVLAFGDFQVEVDGKPVVPGPYPSFGDFTGEVTIELPIASPDLGAFDVVVTYDWANWRDSGDVDSWQFLDSVDIDLALPEQGSSNSEGRLSIRHSVRAPRLAGYDVSINELEDTSLSWTRSRDSLSSDFLATSESGTQVLPLFIQRVTTEIQPKQFEELVDRAWFQTWCTENQREDRAVFRVQGGDDELEIVIPASEASKLRVWVDSELTEIHKIDANLISIDVNASEPSHVVELHYSQPRGSEGILKASLPRIADAEVLGQWYWHIVMPRSECMVAWPRNLTRAHYWDWSSLVPRRESEMTIAELEEWSGGLRSGGKVLAGSSQYLFGAMGEPGEQLAMRTAPLPIYFLALSGTVLVAGLLLIYLKRPLVVLVSLGGVVLALVFLNPAYASIAGQVIAFGIVLVLLGQVLAWLVHYSPRPKLTTVKSSSSWIRGLDKPSVDQPSGDPSSTMAAGGSSRYRSGP